MTNNPVDYAVIAGMAGITYFCRILGYWVMGYVPLTRRVRRALEALPGSIMISMVVPTGLASGLAGSIGVAVALAIMMVSRRDIVAVVVGCASVALLRQAGL